MTKSSSTVAAIASTPAEAKVFVARLAAEGIPAYVHGDSLADEVAISQRLMNLQGVRVMVPATSLARAKEILKPIEIDEEQLAAEALQATEDAETPPPERPSSPTAPGAWARRSAWLSSGAALLFLILWQNERTASYEDALMRYEPTATGLRARMLSDGRVFADYEDLDGNGVYERVTGYGPGGAWTSVRVDEDQDGHDETLTVKHADGTAETWSSPDDDGRYSRLVVTGADGAVLQRLVWHDGQGFVEPR